MERRKEDWLKQCNYAQLEVAGSPTWASIMS